MTQQQAKGTLPRASWPASDFGIRSSSQLQDHYDSSKLGGGGYQEMFGGGGPSRELKTERGPSTAEEYDQMFADAESKAKESRQAASRG